MKKIKKPKPAKILSRFDIHRIWLRSHLHNLNVLERYLPRIEVLVSEFKKSHPKLTVTIDTGSGLSDCYNQLGLACSNMSSFRRIHGSGRVMKTTGNVSRKNLAVFNTLGQDIGRLMNVSPSKTASVTVFNYRIVSFSFDLSQVSI